MQRFVGIFFGLTLGVQAAELSGVSFPEATTLGKKKLQLNGLGKREATIFKVGVYVAGLYLESKSTEASAILASTTAKKIELVFLRDVEKKKTVEAFKENIPKNCVTDCEQLASGITELEKILGDVKKGQHLIFSAVTPDELMVQLDDQVLGSIQEKSLVKNIWGAWLGPKPPNASLKEGLLGTKN